MEGNRRLLRKGIGYPEEYLHFHPGWFQDRLPPDASFLGRIAILRLDADWYVSTNICLVHFYGQVVQDGFVGIDDHGTCDGCRQAVEEFISANAIDADMVQLGDGCMNGRKMEGRP